MSLQRRRVHGRSASALAARRRIARFVALLSAAAGILVFVTTGTGHAAVTPVTDFASYPPALPAGCADGPSALRNVRFTANGYSSSTLYGVVAAPGDLIVMSWDGFTPGCEGVGVGFSSKIATSPVFEVTADYWLYEFSYCGPESGATACIPGANQLTLRVPPSDDVPCYQLDAHLGPPLSRVGPTASYYGPLNGVRNLLISAKNAGGGSCEPLPPCPSDPSMPAVALLCEPPSSTTTTAPATTTTAPPPTSTSAPAVTTTVVVTTTTPPPSSTTTPPPATSTTAPPSTATSAAGSCPPGQVAVAGGCTTAGPSLPTTGRDSRSLASTGALFLLSGLCLVFAYRRSERIGSHTGG